MSDIILIETSTALCSTALVRDGQVVSYLESTEPRSQASLTAPYVKEMLDGAGISAEGCSAVCVSKGPGSYTGLRVGVSTAKGLCFGADIPLIGVGTLDTLVWQAKDEDLVPEGCTAVVPMIDARRMEVYTAVFSPQAVQLSETRPIIVDENSFADILEKGRVMFIGDAADKCREVIRHPNASFVQCFPKASAMLHPAMEALKEKRFEDVAYFEPFYLKQFVATTSHRNLF